MNQSQSQRRADPVHVSPDMNVLSGDSDLARAIATVLQSGSQTEVELIVEQHTVIQVGSSSPYVDAPIRTAYPPASPISAQQPAPAVTDVTVTPVDDPLHPTRDRSFWVTTGIVAGAVTVVGLAVLVVALFVMWLVAGLSAVAAWASAVAPYLLVIAAGIAVIMLVARAKTTCPGLHCPGPH